MNNNDLLAAMIPHLTRIGADSWQPVLARWLTLYQGFYSEIRGDEPHPLEQQVLMALEQCEHVADDDALADRLARLDFLTWRARAASQPWNPLEQAFTTFLAQHTRAGIHIWQSDKEYPSPRETKEWLLSQCARARLASDRRG